MKSVNDHLKSPCLVPCTCQFHKCLCRWTHLSAMEEPSRLPGRGRGSGLVDTSALSLAFSSRKPIAP